MGSDKASLPWLDGVPLLQWMTGALARAGWDPVVVLGPHNHALWAPRLPGALCVRNPHPESGKTTSLAAAARCVPPSAERILISAVDQPRPPALYAALLEESLRRADAVLVPDRAGRRGHPVVLDGALRERLFRLDEGRNGLLGLLDELAASTRRIPCDPQWVRWDCNTPEAYREARAWFESLSPSPKENVHNSCQ